MNKQKGFINIFLIFVVIALAGAFGYVTLVKKPAPEPMSNNSQNTPSTIPPPQPSATPLSSLPTTCTDQQEGAPVITFLSPIFGPVGTEIQIKGCNFAGFEGDLDVYFIRNDGEIIDLYAGNTNVPDGNKSIKLKVQSPCQPGETVYGRGSGIPYQCNYKEFTPGTYAIYVKPWGHKSNSAQFTVTTK